MLVLTRKIGDSVVIDGKILVRVLSLKGGRIRLGVEAPTEVTVLRAELAAPLEQSAATEVDLLPCR